MRSRVLAAVLVSGAVALAGPAWGEGRGGGHSGGGSGRSGGGHVGSGHVSGHANGGGHSAVGHRGPVTHLRGGASGGGARHWTGEHGRWGGRGRGARGGWSGRGGWGGTYGYRGVHGWAGLYLSFPLWWDSYYWWGWPYAWGWPYGWDGYYGEVGADPDSGMWSGGGGSSGSDEITAEAAGPAPVTTDVSPASALVLLNGVVIGSADEFDGSPDYLYLDPGHYTLEFRLSGYRSKVVELNVGSEAKTIVSIELQTDPNAPTAAPAPPPTGLPYGRTFSPEFGPATVRAQPPAGAPPRRLLGERREPAPGAPPAVSGQDVAALRLHVAPANAAVYLDGVLLGTGDELGRLQRGVAVTPGPHRIEVVAPGRTGKTAQVDAVAGREQELTIELQ